METQANIIIKIPAKILSSCDLSFNEKMILGLDYSFDSIKGYTIMSNVQIGELLQIHYNVVGKCRKSLVDNGYVLKNGRKYILTKKLNDTELITGDKRTIYIPFEIYKNAELSAGAKLLWGEYNSLSKGVKPYFAKRSYTSKRLNASEESITNWTKQLYEFGFLSLYEHNYGYCSRQKIVITSNFTL